MPNIGCKRKRCDLDYSPTHSITDENKVLVPPSPFKKMATQIDELDDAVHWSLAAEEAFITLMVAEVNSKALASNCFPKQVFKKIDDELYIKLGKRFTVPKLKIKYNQLRMKHREFSILLNQTGFGWDPHTNTVTATEDVWQRHLRAHPNARQFRRKGCDFYNMLGIIFNTTTATGSVARSSRQQPPTSDEERDLEEAFIGSGVHVNTRIDLEDSPDHVTPTSRKRHSVGPSSSKPSKQSKSSSIEKAIEAWTDFSITRTKYVEKKGCASSEPHNPYSIDACMDALGCLENINDEQFFKACNKFNEPNWRNMFIRMSPDRKFNWVMQL